MTNPLLDTSALPRFADLLPEHAQPAVSQLIAEHREKLAALLDSPAAHDFESLVGPLEEMGHELGRVWSPVGHLQSVLGEPGWREAFNACLPELTRHGTELSQNQSLQQAFERISATLGADAPADRSTLVAHALRDFRLAGVALPESRKADFRDVKQRLAAVQAVFDQNVQDSTDAWHLHVTDARVMAGLPEAVLQRASQQAAANDGGGWRLTLDFPTYQSVMTHAEDRDLRRTFYRAWSTRASDQADNPAWDNRENIEQILALRHRLAELTGFANYAEYSLATKMASSTDEVLDFLTELAAKTRDAGRRELDELRELAREPLEPWDTSFYLEQLKQRKYAVSDEELRQYFPAGRVARGLFELAGKLYGVSLRSVDSVQKWHDTVGYFEVLGSDGEPVGGFYTDLFARSGKRSGAWIDECMARKNMSGERVLPVGYLVCNFSPPDGNGVSLLTHSDVVTLFHEFGHMLHHLLTRVDYPSIAGINGVPWDAVELPSQFMENFAWSYDVLRRASGHFRSGEPLPESLYENLRRSRYCGAALAMLRQLEFALFDFRIHAGYEPGEGARTFEVLESVRDEVSLIRHPDFNRFPMSFSHIFAGGYAAGYYSYKWAEVLAADAFSAFEENGIFDQPTAARFRAEILEVGGSRDIMEAFVSFRGRRPTLDALLRHNGIGTTA